MGSQLNETQLYASAINTPVGNLNIYANQRAIVKVVFEEHDKQKPNINENAITQEASKQLLEYIAQTRQQFDLPLDPEGTQFQQSVWQQLLNVGYGKTASYLDVASALNKPKACRAVGAANGKNPIAIIIPCHRIIGANGSLTGYAGGLSRKTFLLSLEQAI
ncbi:methylated-DNA--[protein]-cysteine S-methyltransferase [Glaciecola sp. 2405UD65-10]|uniref:methylated-DNA--[protein]-cysteine S-methyltransferase n=1 Tax=Glaciecola sp. 2405UD65-10 TaxID=3397244 RepID=UPI003B5A349B